MDRLNLLLKPEWKNDTVSSMTIFADFPASGLPDADGHPELEFPDQAFGGLCPFPEWEYLRVTDDEGDIPFEIADAETLYAAATFKGLYFGRRPAGTVRWSVKLLPRVLPEGYRSSPYYDFRAEPLGLNGSGMFSFILPATGMEKKLDVHLDWDLSDMPEGARGIWSYGEGRVIRELTQWQIMLTMFDTGLISGVENDGFGVYWLSEPDFDARGTAERLLPVFRYEKEHFGDKDAEFRVFLRRDPFEISGGGSACPYAFISGYSEFGGMEADKWFNVLIHEMTHTWPSMTDFNVGEGTWFSEGATEYYCTMLPYQGGFVDAKTTVDLINNKIRDRYLDNLYRDLPNMEIPAIQWKDRRAQTVPYGRGFLYIANAEAKLRRLGKGSIDDIVRRHSIVDPMTPADWEEFISDRLGDEGLQDYNDMKAGKLLIPEDGIFGPEIVAREHEIEIDGVRQISYHWELANEGEENA